MASQEDYEGLLDLIYEASVEPDQWVPAMERFADLVGGDSAWLSQLSVVDGSGSGLIARIDPAMPGRYVDYYGALNPFARKADPRLHMKSWAPNITVDEDWFAKEDLVRTEYYQDFLRPQRVHSVLMMDIAAEGLRIASVNINRNEQAGGFSEADLRIARRLHTHLIRAFTISQKVSAVRGLKDDLADALEHSPYAFFLVEATGRIRHANAAGERLIAHSDGLTSVGGRLTATDPSAARQLHGLIAAAASLDSSLRGGAMALASSGHAVGLSITVAPVRPANLTVFAARPAVLVCVSDLRAGIDSPEDRLKALFGLTAAEARVAGALCEGVSLARVAERFAVSLPTVRSQLARVFEKTGTRNQADLARLMIRVIGGHLR